MKESKVSNHYDEEVKNFGSTAQCTMPDLFIRNLEIKKIFNSINNLSEERTSCLNILEIGCGNGYVLEKISREIKANFIGIDINKKMIELAKKRKLKNVKFLADDILKTKLKQNTFDIIFTERCLINLLEWTMQKKALLQIYKLLKKGSHYIMLEGFGDGLKKLNGARNSLGLEKINPAWHNLYFNKKQFENEIKGKFVSNLMRKRSTIDYDNFLSSYYFGSRVLYPALILNKSEIKYNNEFVEFFSMMESVGNYSPLQLCILQKI